MKNEDYYKSLKEGDYVNYYDKIPYDFDHIGQGVINAIGEWDDSTDYKRGVGITKLDMYGQKTGSSLGCSVFYIVPPKIETL